MGSVSPSLPLMALIFHLSLFSPTVDKVPVFFFIFFFSILEASRPEVQT